MDVAELKKLPDGVLREFWLNDTVSDAEFQDEKARRKREYVTISRSEAELAYNALKYAHVIMGESGSYDRLRSIDALTLALGPPPKPT